MIPWLRTASVSGSLASIRRLPSLLSGSIVTILIVSLLPTAIATGQPVELVVHPKSQFWIQGRATTHSFTCEVNRVEGSATLSSDADTMSESKAPRTSEASETSVAVAVPVKSFDCGRDRMTRDLQETLKMDEHPEITFELIHATVTGQMDSSAHWRRIELLGTLTIAGRKRLNRLQVAARALGDHRFRIRGCHPVRMTDHNIEPPTKALGLIKVKDRVEVQFDLLAYAPEQSAAAPFDSLTVKDPPDCSSK